VKREKKREIDAGWKQATEGGDSLIASLYTVYALQKKGLLHILSAIA